MKIGISIGVDVTKVDKSRLGKGKFLNMTTFIDTDNPSEYGDHGFIAESGSKEEREDGYKGTILGNCKVFWKEDGQQRSEGPDLPAQEPPEDDIPV